MSKTLAKMTGRAKPEVTQFIVRMEAKFGYPSADVRLQAEITQAAKQKIAQLGLDPNDTTGQELYYALRAKFDQDSLRIDRAIGITASMDFKQRANRAVDFVRQTFGDSEIFTLRNIAVKNLLRALPPQKIMNYWHYRSLESMLKRADLAKVLLCASYIESAAWQKKLAQYTSRLNAADYQQRPVNFIVLETSYGRRPSGLVGVSQLSGLVALWPDHKLKKASSLHLILLLLQGLDKLGVSAPPKAIVHTHPALNWWADAGHLVSLHDGQSISFNLHDVAANHLYNKNYAEDLTHYAEVALWEELGNRYSRLAEAILSDVQAQTIQKTTKMNMPTAAQLVEELASV